jgi:hypothetical protein
MMDAIAEPGDGCEAFFHYHEGSRIDSNLQPND